MKDSGLQRNFVAHDFEPSWRCYTLYLLYFAIFAHAQNTSSEGNHGNANKGTIVLFFS